MTDKPEPDEDEELSAELAEGALDPDEVPSWLEPWDEESDDET